MKTIKFIGDPSDDFSGPDTIMFYDLSLKKGIAKTCIDPHVLAKADASSHFVVKDVKTRVVGAKAKHDPDGE